LVVYITALYVNISRYVKCNHGFYLVLYYDQQMRNYLTICEIIVHLLVIVQSIKRSAVHVFIYYRPNRQKSTTAAKTPSQSYRKRMQPFGLTKCVIHTAFILKERHHQTGYPCLVLPVNPNVENL